MIKLKNPYASFPGYSCFACSPTNPSGLHMEFYKDGDEIISKWDPKRLYLAYHEGRGGYARGSYKSKPKVVRIANRVDWQAKQYGVQLRQCEDRFKCRHWYQVWPFCS